MPTVHRTSRAHLDLVEIGLRIAAENPVDAGKWLDAIDEKCRLLANMPEMGRKREELAHGLRSFAAGEYVIFYRPAPDGVVLI
jgi:toxin ParE1/3/4